MSELGLHPAAVAATGDVARAMRDEVDRAVAAAPHENRHAFAQLVHGEPDESQQGALEEVFRRVYAAFTRRDWELNTYGMHPVDYVFQGNGENILVDLPATLRGVDGYLDGMQGWTDAWSEIALLSEAVVHVGPGRILSWATFVLRGSGSGITLRQTTAVLYEWRDEWLVGQRYWWDRDAGTRAAGVDPAAVVAAR